MIDDAQRQTCGWNLQTTCDVAPHEDDARFLRTAVRRCVRNAAGQQSPRNPFERYVTERLSSDDVPGRVSANISQLADEICRRIHGRLPLRSDAGRSPA